MRDRRLITGFVALTLLVALGGVSAAQGSAPLDATLQEDVGTAFTYQGSLTQGDAPVNAPHELRFILYDSEAGGSQVGDTLTVADVPVDKGVFTVPLDFGPDVFDGRALWLEVAVRPAGGAGTFTTLSPRQRLTPTPYVLHANAWSLHGNAGTEQRGVFLGTTDGEPLVVKTSNIEALRVGANGYVGIGTEAPEARLESVTPLGGAALLGTSSERGVVGRLGSIPCPGPFAVGGCAGATGATGVFGWSTGGVGVYGASTSSYGAEGQSTTSTGVRGVSESSYGVDGYSQSGIGIHGHSNTNRGVEGTSGSGIGVLGDSSTRGVVGTLGRISCPGPYAVGGCAGVSGAIGVYADSTTRGVVGTLGEASCAGSYAVGGCAGGAAAAGVYGQSNAAAIFARTDTGDLFVGVNGQAETRRARINVNGRGFFNDGTQTGGADYAESMRTTDDPAELEPGDVLSLDPQSGYAVRLSREPNSRLVAGVYSTRPSLLAVGDHGIDDTLAGEVPVALLGVVPTKVTAANGPIQIGDLLVTSALPGRAMKAQPDVVGGVLVYPTGAILGKALESLLQGTGVIKVLVTLR